MKEFLGSAPDDRLTSAGRALLYAPVLFHEDLAAAFHIPPDEAAVVKIYEYPELRDVGHGPLASHGHRVVVPVRVSRARRR